MVPRSESTETMDGAVVPDDKPKKVAPATGPKRSVTTTTRRVAKPIIDESTTNGAPEKPEPNEPTLNEPDKAEESIFGEGSPWSTPSQLADKQGLCMLLFSHPGVGKTTLATTMINAADGSPLLFVNFDEEVRSIADRNDIAVWPGVKQGGKISNWQQASSFCDSLVTKRHPFKSICVDTLNSAYDKFLFPMFDEEARPGTDQRQIYGKANDELLRIIRQFAALSRDRGINILFTSHSEEKQVGDNGPIYVRPAVTPGVIKGIYQSISTVGYYEVGKLKSPRKLILAPTARITAKNHQPRTGRQLPGEITAPDLGRIIDHMRGVRPYPVPTKDNDN